MRLAWAIVAGAAGAGVLAWWLARDEATAAQVDAGGDAPAARSADGGASAGPALYRWRDDAGIVQITDIPPEGRDYTRVDVGALERRNTVNPDPAIEAAR